MTTLFCRTLLPNGGLACRRTLVDPAGDEVPLSWKGGEVPGVLEVSEGSSLMAQPGSKGAADDMEEMIGLQFAAIGNGIECGHACLRAMHAGDGHGAVHGGDR